MGSWSDLTLWCEVYNNLCKEVGISLAESDGDKAFTPQKQGTLLGTFFSIPEWTWSLGEKKLKKLLNILFDVVENEYVSGELIQKLNGKTCYYQHLFSAKFERGFILEALRSIPDVIRHSQVVKDKRARVVCSKNLKSQCAWWIRRIWAAKEAGNLPIPFHHALVPSCHVALYPDAAGAGDKEYKKGVGCVMDLYPRVFMYMMYPDLMRLGLRTRQGHSSTNKMCFLEGCAAMIGLLMCPELLCNQTIYIYSDNAGLVGSFRKGSSHCMYTYSLLLAMRAVARSLNSRVIIKKVGRCSSTMSTIADLLSKGFLREAEELMGDSVWGNFSSTFTHWMSDPFPTRGLGLAIVMELKRKMDIPVFETEWNEEVIPLIRHNK